MLFPYKIIKTLPCEMLIFIYTFSNIHQGQPRYIGFIIYSDKHTYLIISVAYDHLRMSTVWYDITI